MAQSTDHPSKLFITAGAAFQTLETSGVDVRSFLQRIIDDPEFRRNVAMLTVHPAHEVLNLPDEPNSLGMERLFLALLGRFAVPVQEEQQHYRTSQGMLELFEHVNPRDAAIVIARFGLIDGQMRAAVEIGQKFHCSPKNIRRLEARGLSVMRRAVDRRRVGLQFIEAGVDTPIEHLDLSDRAFNCLKRAGINSLDQLTKKTVDDLLAITNFGQKSLDEVLLKLRDLDLRLA